MADFNNSPDRIPEITHKEIIIPMRLGNNKNSLTPTASINFTMNLTQFQSDITKKTGIETNLIAKLNA